MISWREAYRTKVPCRRERQTMHSIVRFVLLATIMNLGSVTTLAESIELELRTRKETRPASGIFAPQWRTERWKTGETALIICDMWDAHHCYNAVQRVKDIAPRMNEVIKKARAAGVFVIHSPSSCLAPYEGHPARLRASAAPTAVNLPADIGEWCHKIPAEEQGTYPIDQSDGGEDDDPVVHEQWHEKLRGMGRNPDAPWTRQYDVLEISDDDAITDSGVETWNLLESRGIKNVMLVGVHTNMCVLGRPFGLRQLAKNGKNVVLVRDMTDTMYNPAMWPYVNHHTGTDLIIEHIEKFVCPTVLSTDILGGDEFRFQSDTRPRLAVIVSEFEYETYKTLPKFAAENLGKDFKVDYVINDDRENHDLPGLENVLANADLALISIWRRSLRPDQLDTIRQFVESGKPIVAVRTTSHAFAQRDGTIPTGRAAWPDFDRVVLGGNYQGHHGNHADKGDAASEVWIPESSVSHPVVSHLQPGEFTVPSWLYKMSPLESDAKLLMMGRVGDAGPEEPVAWTFATPNGGRAFYTSLGHPGDFELPQMNRMLANAIYWAAGLEIPRTAEQATKQSNVQSLR